MIVPDTPVEDMFPAQLGRVRDLLELIRPTNRFYSRKFAGIASEDIRTAADFARLPFTTKAELGRRSGRAPASMARP